MLRLSAEGIALFLSPFGVYAILLFVGHRLPFLRKGWGPRPLLILAAFGFGLTILGLLGLGVFSGRYRGAYVPAHLDAGRLVPGHME